MSASFHNLFFIEPRCIRWYSNKKPGITNLPSLPPNFFYIYFLFSLFRKEKRKNKNLKLSNLGRRHTCTNIAVTIQQPLPYATAAIRLAIILRPNSSHYRLKLLPATIPREHLKLVVPPVQCH